MSASQVRDLVFDLGGVLIDWDPAYLYRDHLGIARAEVHDLLTNICSQSWHEQLDRGLPFAVGTRDLAAQYPSSAARIQQWDSHWERMFKGSRGGADRLLAGLVGRGYRLHALSNYPSEKLDFLYDRFGFMRCFHSVTISGLLGIAKPDPAIFAYVSALLAGRRGAFFDDRIENVDAAARAGFFAYHCPADATLEVVVGHAIGS